MIKVSQINKREFKQKNKNPKKAERKCSFKTFCCRNGHYLKKKKYLTIFHGTKWLSFISNVYTINILSPKNFRRLFQERMRKTNDRDFPFNIARFTLNYDNDNNRFRDEFFFSGGLFNSLNIKNFNLSVNHIYFKRFGNQSRH